ncbi:MAG: hypothetical protein ACFFAN_11290 [Promethearchaeota archaeon]
MISKIFIITSGGILCYSKNLITEVKNRNDPNEDIVSGFLTAFSNFSHEIKGGKIKSLNFRNFNYVYSYDKQYGCIFVIVIDIEDLEDEARKLLEIMKKEFIKRYGHLLENFSGNTSNFLEFNKFVEENIFIPPRVLLIGEIGVGKTTIMNLFPGDTILELDEDLNEIIEKTIKLSTLKNLKQFILREIDIKELIDKSKLYRRLLNSIDVICLVTNSAASNLSRTKKYLSRLKYIVNKVDFYIIANFQDVKDTAFEPEEIQKSFNIKTYGFSAIQKDSKEKINLIFAEMLKNSLLDKIEKRKQHET